MLNQKNGNVMVMIILNDLLNGLPNQRSEDKNKSYLYRYLHLGFPVSCGGTATFSMGIMVGFPGKGWLNKSDLA